MLREVPVKLDVLRFLHLLLILLHPVPGICICLCHSLALSFFIASLRRSPVAKFTCSLPLCLLQGDKRLGVFVEQCLCLSFFEQHFTIGLTVLCQYLLPLLSGLIVAHCLAILVIEFIHKALFLLLGAVEVLQPGFVTFNLC